jgi:hypothetical protein
MRRERSLVPAEQLDVTEPAGIGGHSGHRLFERLPVQRRASANVEAARQLVADLGRDRDDLEAAADRVGNRLAAAAKRIAHVVVKREGERRLMPRARFGLVDLPPGEVGIASRRSLTVGRHFEQQDGAGDSRRNKSLHGDTAVAV